MTNVLWIKNDFRLEDNTALIKAIDDSVKYEEKLLIVFLIEPNQLKPGLMSHDYFFKSLDYFYKKLKRIGLDIYFMYGELIESFKRLIKDFPNIRRVYYNCDESGYGYFRDNQVTKIFRNASIDCFGFMDKHLHQAKEILTSNNTNYKVFTPYYLKWKDRAKNLELTLDYNKIKLVSLEGFQEMIILRKKYILMSLKI